jgi:HTH-type transcriptional regulator / antitoxin HipB
MNIERLDQLALVVKARRRELGLTQAELAGLSEVSPRFVFDLEAGKQTVQLDLVFAVTRALGLTWTLAVR